MERKYVGKRYKGAIDVPEGIDVDEAIKIYNQGWGHCLRKVIGVLRTKGTPIDTEWFGPYIASLKKTDKIHIVRPLGETTNE